MKSLLLLLACLALPASLEAQSVGPWNLDELFQTPAFRWDDDASPIRSLIYEGQPLKGLPTEVFAFYASPSTLDPTVKGPFPGVVLIHGGGGTAFAEWTWLWAERGYAAIAMDLSGRRPPAPIFDESGRPDFSRNAAVKPRTRLAKGGLDHGRPEKFDCVTTADISDDWPYHAASSVIRAHSLLRSFEEVDPERTAVTGISWGGYSTCLVASLDHRFKAAVPVYGCGFLHEGESVQKPAIDSLGDDRMKWVESYDVSSWLPRCRVPMFFVNGTNDKHYVLDSYQKSFDVVPAEKQMRIQVMMRHGHPPGWAPKEIGLFVDSKCRGGIPLPKPTSVARSAKRVRVEYTGATTITNAQIHYTTDDGPRVNRKWKSLNATVRDGFVVGPAPPLDANTWFVSLTDDRDAMVTTDVQFQ